MALGTVAREFSRVSQWVFAFALMSLAVDAGAQNNALSFNGTNQFVTFGTAPGLGTPTFTLEVWFNWTGGGTAATTGTGGITDMIPLVTKGRGENEGSNVDEGEAADSTLTFKTSANNISARPRTAASVNWVPPPWTVVGQVGPAQQTPNLASVIQQIVSRPGWVPGNSMVLIVTGTGHREAEAYNGDQAGAALLHVEYQ